MTTRMQVSASFTERLQLWLPTGLFAPRENAPLYDRTLLVTALTLMALGLIMVVSASIPEAEKRFHAPLHYGIRHGVYLCLALGAGMFVLQQPVQRWLKWHGPMLLVVVLMLIAVLVIGRRINGAARWIALGPITVQPAELAKLFFFVYLAGYLVRKHDEVREHVKGFAKPLFLFAMIGGLLMFQPDMGSTVVMFVTTLGMLFLAGARLWQFIGIVLVGCAGMAALIIFEPYRLRRVTSFANPWEDQFGSGYQLTQSLMAFGRGNFWGEGLGNSIQKLHYLPEAHTDFVMAILGEELGFVGIAFVVCLLGVMVFRALLIGRKALMQERYFEGFLAQGVGIWFCFQGVVNIGASAGMLPTKGLTLPLVSYGGSSLIVMSVAVALLLRIDFEMRMDNIQATREAT